MEIYEIPKRAGLERCRVKKNPIQKPLEWIESNRIHFANHKWLKLIDKLVVIVAHWDENSLLNLIMQIVCVCLDARALATCKRWVWWEIKLALYFWCFPSLFHVFHSTHSHTHTHQTKFRYQHIHHIIECVSVSVFWIFDCLRVEFNWIMALGLNWRN